MLEKVHLNIAIEDHCSLPIYLCICCSMEDLLKDTDSELEEDTSSKSKSKQKVKKKKKSGDMILKEEAEDIVDFMDASAARQITR